MWQFLICIYGSFTNTVTSQDYIALNGRIISEEWIEKGVGRSSHVRYNPGICLDRKRNNNANISNCTQQGTQIRGSQIHLLFNFSYLFWP